MVTPLAQARAAVEPVLRRRVETLPDTMRLLAGYHFGWWDADGVMKSDGATGKAVRPALVLATSRALGGAMETALTVAAAVELVHNFTLIHDDVHDQDESRHGQPALWTVFGTTEALLAGNALMALGLETLASRSGMPPAAFVRLARCIAELCEGQSADVAFERRAHVSLDECITMSARKTGVLLGAACAITALTTGAGEDVVDAFDQYGIEIGVAFQLANDLLGIWGDEAALGKPTGSDLARLKKTLPIVHALESRTEAGDELAALYALGQPLDEARTRHAAGLVGKSGAREWAEAELRRRLDVALKYVATAVGPVEELTALAELAIEYYERNTAG